MISISEGILVSAGRNNPAAIHATTAEGVDKLECHS